MTPLISLTQARQHIVDAVQPLAVENCLLGDALGRTLAQDIIARHDQPAQDISAMDGYAVRRQDCGGGAALSIMGEARAGAPFSGSLAPGQAVRISTGAYVPQGADHILIQEEAEKTGETIAALAAQSANGFIRARGRDFSAGTTLLASGSVLTATAIALAAAAGRGVLSVYRRPNIAILTNGDELCDPGTPLRPGALYDSNGPALAAQVTSWGGAIGWQGRGGDSEQAMAEMLASCCNHDVLVIAGGASVGPHDIVRAAFSAQGGKLLFSRIAVKPGKPAWCGLLGRMLVIGLPGNPASAFVTAQLLVRLAIERMTGHGATAQLPLRPAMISAPLSANGPRETFLRAALKHDDAGQQIISPLEDQDSSLLRPMVAANALLHRAAGAIAAEAQETVSYIALEQHLGGCQ